MLHVATARSTSSRTDIESRLTGRFYTPRCIADALAVKAASPAQCPATVCDPFCGDGRLIVAWLNAQSAVGSLRGLKTIALWDFDASAVGQAHHVVASTLARLHHTDVTIETWVGDTFSRKSEDRFELILTNPPWEQLKPDSRDAVKDIDRYRSEIRAYAFDISAKYPEASTSRSRTIGGYTVNLARAGAIAALRATAVNGQLCIVLPSTIFADQVSGGFRERFFSDAAVDEIAVYPAEAKLFAGVDQSFVTVTAWVGRATTSYCIRRFDPGLKIVDARQHHMPHKNEAVPVNVDGAAYAVIGELAERHPRLEWLECDLRFGLKLGRELDETRIREAFSEDNVGIPFVKGRNIGRYSFDPSNLPRIDRSKRRLPATIECQRIAWRDVSRPSQKRRVHACVIPAGVVTGNSIGIASFASDRPDQLYILAALMNSVVFEAQVRSKLATNHVSQGVLRTCAVPYSLFEKSDTIEEIGNALRDRCPTSADQIYLEVLIAKSYQLSRDEFASLLGPFDKITEQERDHLLSKEVWN